MDIGVPQEVCEELSCLLTTSTKEENLIDNLNNNNKTYVWIGIGCFGLLLCVLGLVIFGIGGLAWLGNQEPQNVDIKVDTPINAEINKAVEIRITITNTGTVSITLDSLDMTLSYLDGFFINQSDPPYTDTYEFDNPVTKEKARSFTYQRAIMPGDTLTVTFRGVAVKAGDFSGEVNVCTNSFYECQASIARTIVK